MYPRTVTPSEWSLCLGDGVAGNHAVKDGSGCARRYGAGGVPQGIIPARCSLAGWLCVCLPVMPVVPLPRWAFGMV